MLASVLFNVQSLQAGAFAHLASFPLCSRRLTMTSQGMRAARESEVTVSARAERLAAKRTAATQPVSGAACKRQACSPLELGSARSLLSTSQLVGQHPGELFRHGVSRIKGRLSTIHGAEALTEDGRPVVQHYYSVLLRPTLDDEASARAMAHAREMRTLAAAMDCLLQEAPHKAGDLLMARFKSLEEHSRTGSWEIASELEAFDNSGDSIMTEGERHRIAMLHRQRARLHAARKRFSAVSEGSGPDPPEEEATSGHSSYSYYSDEQENEEEADEGEQQRDLQGPEQEQGCSPGPDETFEDEDESEAAERGQSSSAERRDFRGQGRGRSYSERQHCWHSLRRRR